MRQIVAFVVCAIKDWIDDFYPCYMWKDPLASAGAGAAEHDDDHVTDEEEEVTSPLAALGPMEPPKGPSDKARLMGFLKAKKAQAPPDCVPERPQITRELAPWAVSVKPAGKQTASEKAHLAQNNRQQRRPGRAWIDPTTGEKLWTDHESGETFANHGCD